MTKDEYKQYLESDYWKGYSYSIIKERNFTCEDCGRSFPGERNKLHVHHLVYHGDIAPWSYKPEEVIVLCHECHERRHGIYHPHPEKEETTSSSQTAGNWSNPEGKDPLIIEKRSKIGWSTVALIFAAWVFVFWSVKYIFGDDKHPETSEPTLIEEPEPYVPHIEKVTAPEPAKKQNRTADQKKKTAAPGSTATVAPSSSVPESVTPPAIDQVEPEVESTMSLSDQIYRKHLEDQARRAGVSTEGTDSEISDRIYRKHLEDQARRAGVSTEGSDSEISDRIYRKHLEDQARRAGVSTEGTNEEISDRIYRKHLEDQARRAGIRNN